MEEDKDVAIAIGHVVDIVSSGLLKYKNQGIKLDRKTHSFWNKIKKGMPEEVSSNLEANPEDEKAKEAFATELERLMKIQNVKMNVVALLFNSGIHF